MNMLGGSSDPREDSFTIDGRGRACYGARRVRNGIAFVHQELAMLASMTVAENVLIEDFPTRRHRRHRREAARMQPSARPIGLRFAHRPGRETRHGRPADGRDRARIASDPSILIFDEPTSSLSTREKRGCSKSSEG